MNTLEGEDERKKRVAGSYGTDISSLALYQRAALRKLKNGS
ncbi:hypothetical protein [Lactococcus ileimucosae]